MDKLFQKIPVELTKQPSPKKTKIVITFYWGGWFVKKLGQKLPPLNRIRLSKKSQKEEDEIKIKLHKANKDWNYWRFQIH